jgi:quercetin dioxygenase-like cupin family protein
MGVQIALRALVIKEQSVNSNNLWRERMKRKTKFILGSVSAACAVAGIAIATPSLGILYNVIPATGTVNHDVHVHAHVALPGSEDGFRAEVETEGAANFIVQDVIFAPRGTTGWHKHPGVLLLSLTADSGPVDWYDANCVKHVYNAGDSWTESTSLHDVVNTSSSNAHFIVTYIVARGVNKRTDEPAPPCAAALGLM